MKRIALLLCLSASTLASGALSGELKSEASRGPGIVETTNRWDGFYVGVFGGVSAGNTTIDGTVYGDAEFPPQAPGYPDGLIDAANAMSDFAFPGAVGTYGVQAGYNFQLENIVLGLQVDLGRRGLSGSAEAEGLYLTSFLSVTNSFETDWLLTLRPRVGVLASDDLLIYATGGVALANVTVEHTSSGGQAQEGFAETANLLGWVAGAGVEYALDDNWSLGAEYTYTDIGMSETTRLNSNFGLLNTLFQNDLKLSPHALRMSVNYRF